MAKPVKMPKNREFVFKSSSKGGSKYPWDNWLNGDLLLLERSTGVEGETGSIVEIHEQKDYEAPTNYMPAKLKTAARNRYKIVQVSRVDADGNRLGDALIIRARDMTADERVAEDALRIEEKEEAKAKKLAKRSSPTDETEAA